MIPNYTVYSDKVFLTANYYIEYLGFSLLYKDEETDSPYVWLELNGQFLLIWPWNNKLGVARKVVFEVPDIFKYFSEIEERAKINVPIYRRCDGTYKFSILDCEENVIHFIEQTSARVFSEEELNITELS